MINAYYNRVNAQWQHTRLIVYTVACTVMEKDKRPDIFEFMPLKGDPTPEQMMEEMEEQRQAMIDEQRQFNEMLRAEKANAKK